MQIGGEDHVVEFKDTPALREWIRRYAASRWPGAMILEDPFNPATWFVHQDQASVVAWDAEGGTADNQCTMFTVMFGDKLTLVTALGSNIAREIADGLRSCWRFQGFVLSG